MLEIRNLVKRYPIGKSKKRFVTALDNVSITFPEKGLIFLLGKSGSGKSTLLNSIGGLDTFDSGEIIIKGKSSRDFNQSDFDSYRNTFVGFVFQEYNVLEEFTVAKNLSLAIELQGKKASKELVDELLTSVEMQDYSKRKPNQLSGGQKQRIAIARALIKNPEIIMADEPTGALDSNTGKQVMETLKKLSQEKLVIIVSHDREFAEIYGDRIVELKDGKIIRDVTKKEVAPEKSASGVSFIDNEIIHIKKGQSLTQEDLNRICNQIINNAQANDTIISLSPNANNEVKKATNITDDGNREVFKETLPTDVQTQQYSGNYKLIKSKLKFSDSFKMGASALKNKVAKLVFTIFLSFLAFGMFGIIDTFSAFDRAKAINATVAEHNYKTVAIVKEKEGQYNNNVMAIKDKDIENLKSQYPDIEFKNVVNAGISVGSSVSSLHYNNSMYIQGLNLNQASVLKTVFYSGMTHFENEDELAKHGISLVAGRLPMLDNEICITKRHFDIISSQNQDKNLTYDLMFTEYKRFTFSRISGEFNVVGIIDDGKDWSKYSSITTEELSTNYILSEQIARELSYGYSHILLVNENSYNKYLNKSNNMYVRMFKNGEEIRGSYTDEFSVWDYAYLKEKYSMAEHFSNYYFTYKNGSVFDSNYTNGSPFIKLPKNHIILSGNSFDNAFGTDENTRFEKLMGETPLTVNLQTMGKEETEYSTVATYTVVGYLTNYGYSYSSIASDETIAEYNSLIENKVYRIVNGENTLYSSSLFTFEDAYSKMYSYDLTLESFVDNRIEYMKGGAIQNGNLRPLGLNEVILSSWELQQLGSGQELYDMIDAGLSFDFYLDWEGKNYLFTLKVVGVSQNSGYYMSAETYDKIKKDHLIGSSYSIALLSNNSEINESFIKTCENFNSNREKFTVQISATPILDNFGDIFKTMTEVLLYVGIGFAVFAALLLMNFITTSISYKKREIGILRALGARGSDVFGIFFNESLIIAMINFALATIATFVVCTILNGLIMTQLGLDLVILSVGLRQVVLMLGISLVTAFISSFIPVMKIAHKKPIDAINNR